MPTVFVDAAVRVARNIRRLRSSRGLAPTEVTTAVAEDEPKAILLYSARAADVAGYRITSRRAWIAHAWYRLRRPDPLLLVELSGRAGVVLDTRWIPLGAHRGVELVVNPPAAAG